MKHKPSILKVFCYCLMIFLIFSCKKNPPKTLPVVITSAAKSITSSSATVNGTVTSDGGDPVMDRGICWSLTNELPSTEDNKTSNGAGTGSFDSSLTGLNPGTTYHLRAYASNSIGTAYGNSISFNTLATAPVLTTAVVTSITVSSAISGGTITSDGGSAITARGVCWNVSPNPDISVHSTTDGTGAGGFTSNLTGLTSSSVYYVRAYASNIIGTTYGNEVTFTTSGSQTETVTDIDGNVYQTVKIGSQVWMVENLKVTKYRNGDQIPVITDYTQWDPLTTGARVTNTSVQGYVNTYGWFYNWYAVSDNRSICPAGWHIPSKDELSTLSDYLGGDTVSGGKLKESGTVHWNSPNYYSTNESGFTALPGAFYFTGPGYVTPGDFGTWWTSTEYNSTDSWNWNLDNSSTGLYKVYNKKSSGFSIRCVKD